MFCRQSFSALLLSSLLLLKCVRTSGRLSTAYENCQVGLRLDTVGKENGNLPGTSFLMAWPSPSSKSQYDVSTLKVLLCMRWTLCLIWTALRFVLHILTSSIFPIKGLTGTPCIFVLVMYHFPNHSDPPDEKWPAPIKNSLVNILPFLSIWW